MWFEYVVGYDKQEQRSLGSSVRRQLGDLQHASITRLERAAAALPSLLKPGLIVLGSLTGLFGLVLLGRRVQRFGWTRGLRVWQSNEAHTTPVEFYQRLLKTLEKQGIKRELYQTPLEFASSVGANEARAITDAYNRVRFGADTLSDAEQKQIEELLARIENAQGSN